MFLRSSIVMLIFALILGQASAQTKQLKKSDKQTETSVSITPTLVKEKVKPLYSEPMLLPNADLSEPTHLRECEGEEEEEDKEVEMLKEEANAMRPFEEASLGKILNPFENASDLGTSLVSSFNATHVGSGNPPDNTMAISNGGYIVTSVNSRIAVYNTAGSVLGQWTLYTFFNGAGAGVVNDFFDPNVIYDPGADRFVFTCCVGRQSANSRVLVAFSKTNNPTQGWWSYYLTGNPLNNGAWFDFPRIGVSTVEVFVTGNLYNNAGGNLNSVIYQIPKTAGYAGGSLSWQYWHTLPGSPFTITPISSGNNTNYGPAFYFLSHNTGSGTQTKLYRVTNAMSATNETITYNTVNCPAYQIGANASQSGTTKKLAVNDARAISGFFLNGIIHYVFHSAVSGTTFNRVHYHRLNPTALTLTSTQIWTGGWDLVYPCVAWAGTVTTDKSVLISFQFSNSANFPGVGAVAVNDAMTIAPNWISAGWGTGFVNTTSGTVNRWGDYTGICRRRNSNPARVWGSASFGNTANNWTAKVFQLGFVPFTGDEETVSRSTVQELNMGLTEMSVAPNPAEDATVITLNQAVEGDIQVQVFDLTGSLVQEKRIAKAPAGVQQITLDTRQMTSGTYFVRASSQNSNITKHEKLVVVH